MVIVQNNVQYTIYFFVSDRGKIEFYIYFSVNEVKVQLIELYFSKFYFV